MSRILITGGLGFVGGRLAKRLSANHDVTVTSRNTPSQEILALHGNIHFIKHSDLLDAGKFPKDLEWVIHLAALNEWDCVKNPSEAISVNIDQTRLILENSIENKVQHFIYFSTAHIYGAPLRGLITEETLPRPAHPYSITHKAAEDYVLAAGRQNRINPVIIRLSNAFGAPVLPTVNRWTLLANDLCKQAVEKGTLHLSSNGCQYRDFICLEDVESVIERMILIKKLKHFIYNLGSGIGMRVIDLANLIATTAINVLKKNIPVLRPVHTADTLEPQLDFSIARLVGEGFVVSNDVNLELERLLQFCSDNFSG
jgi:UDP-glucose 4-epimerase